LRQNTGKGVKAKVKKLPPIHPGEILREEFMLPRGLSQNALARALNVPPRRINEIVLEKRGITADTALRLALALARGNGRGWRSRVRVKRNNISTSAEMWTSLQADYDLRLARHEKARVIERDVEPLAALELAMA
jgi:addiction module HigA family antidote